LEIPIANIYYLLCYAWETLEEKDTLAEVGNQDTTQLLDLFARVLVSGTRRLIRRGLDRGYISQADDFPGVRGKLLITQTVRRDLLRRGRAACVWDELEYSTLPNRILKATFESLYREADLAPKPRADVHDALRWLAPVKPLDLRAEHFRRVQLHSNNRIYVFLLHVCEFIYEHWLPDEKNGPRRFRDFIREGLPDLFEKFVLNFYRHELGEDWQVGSPWIYWQMSQANVEADGLVPDMKTDVCLRGPGGSFILDTKFYAQALKAGAYGAPKLPPANLYQLYTYLRQKSSDDGWEHAQGILLYPRTNKDFCVEFTTHGHRIRALTLDLGQPWPKIHAALMNVVASAQMSAVAFQPAQPM
jgi:5-methylcytosine-specific restriction enzyme subunit McrC